MSYKSLVEVKSVLDKIHYPNFKFTITESGHGYLLQTVFMAKDITSDCTDEVTQKSRKWYISPWSTESEIVETAFACVQRAMMHEVSELFTYKGRNVMSPHFNVNSRVKMVDNDEFDIREDNRTNKEIIDQFFY